MLSRWYSSNYLVNSTECVSVSLHWENCLLYNIQDVLCATPAASREPITPWGGQMAGLIIVGIDEWLSAPSLEYSRKVEEKGQFWRPTYFDMWMTSSWGVVDWQNWPVPCNFVLSVQHMLLGTGQVRKISCWSPTNSQGVDALAQK